MLGGIEVVVGTAAVQVLGSQGLHVMPLVEAAATHVLVNCMVVDQHVDQQRLTIDAQVCGCGWWVWV